MKLLPFEKEVSLDGVGSVILHYGKTGCGKSTSIFATLPGVIVYLCMERRDAHRSALAAGRSTKDYRIGVYTTFNELLEFANDFENQIKTVWDLDLSQIGSVVIDGISQLMMNISLEMAEQIYDTKDDKAKKSLIAETKMTPEAYGSLAKQMVRAVDAFAKLSQQYGKVIVMNALLTEQHNKWDDTYTAEPRFEGNMFGKLYAGMCDLIGLVEPRYERKTIKDEIGEDKVISRLIFPPRVKYEKEEWENFTCKWSGKRLVNTKNPDALIQPILDFNVILGLKGKKNKIEDITKQKKTKGKQEEPKIVEQVQEEPETTKQVVEPITEPMVQEQTETEITTEETKQQKISWS